MEKLMLQFFLHATAPSLPCTLFLFVIKLWSAPLLVKNIGVLFDDSLSLVPHATATCKSAFYPTTCGI